MSTPTPEERIAILERVVVQLLALHFVNVNEKESIMKWLREGVETSLSSHSPLSTGMLDNLDRLFTSALETSKGMNEIQQ